VSSRLEVGSQVAVIALCIIVAADIAWTRFGMNRALETRRNAPPPALSSGPTEYATGEKAPAITGINYAGKGTLLLVVRSGCHFCTDSMPLYRKLRATASEKGVRLVAVSTDPVDVCQGYLASHGVQTDSVLSVSPGALRVRGTPTLVLVDANTIVRKVWSGRLPTDREIEVVAAINGLGQ
jgi:peroxiredoxin